ncbi:hypothetical protein IL306_007049 [Fusarium sp. DS 682]|nr:hypothetical protein IL306_007049 [Fusarium sp. DS 682]
MLIRIRRPKGVTGSLHRSKLLSKEINGEHATAFVNEKHVEDLQENTISMYNEARSNSVDDHIKHPLDCALECRQPKSRGKTEGSGGKKDKLSAQYVGGWHPPDIDEAL